MSWIGGVVEGVGKVFLGSEDSRAQNKINKLSDESVDLQEATANQMLEWANIDWERYQQDVFPLEDAMIEDAENGIQSQEGKVIGKINADTSQQFGKLRGDVNQDLTAGGVNPNSGRFADVQRTIGNAESKATGFGINRGREGERNRVDDINWNKKVQVVSMGKGIPIESSVGAGRAVGQYAQSSAVNRGYEDMYSRSAANNFSGAGQSFGSIDWGKIGKNNDVGELGPGDTSEGEPGWADGGVVEGPGTGKSDSVPAVIDGKHPARVSDGEIYIPPEVVQRVGLDNLKKLIAMYHRSDKNTANKLRAK